MLANKGSELVCRGQECDCIDKPKQSQNYESRQPIGISLREESLENCFAVVHSEILLISRQTGLQRSTVIQAVVYSPALTVRVMRFSFRAFTTGWLSDKSGPEVVRGWSRSKIR